MERYKVVMLPTNEATTLFLDNGFLWQRREPSVVVNDAENQHLYVVESNVTVEIGDIVLAEFSTTFSLKITKDNLDDCCSVINKKGDKIIASTNTSLNLPIELSENFIQNYIDFPDGKVVVNANVAYWFKPELGEMFGRIVNKETELPVTKDIVKHHTDLTSEDLLAKSIRSKVATWQIDSDEPLAMLTIAEMQWLSKHLIDKL